MVRGTVHDDRTWRRFQRDGEMLTLRVDGSRYALDKPKVDSLIRESERRGREAYYAICGDGTLRCKTVSDDSDRISVGKCKDCPYETRGFIHTHPTMSKQKRRVRKPQFSGADIYFSYKTGQTLVDHTVILGKPRWDTRESKRLRSMFEQDEINPTGVVETAKRYAESQNVTKFLRLARVQWYPRTGGVLDTGDSMREYNPSY